uniref:Uncharacterized protein n=1 Tax=viral metagenome TaxID=1070528 RepID=A0A6C0BH85_9ZZZZ
MDKRWNYNSANFGECKGCPIVSYPNKIPGCSTPAPQPVPAPTSQITSISYFQPENPSLFRRFPSLSTLNYFLWDFTTATGLNGQGAVTYPVSITRIRLKNLPNFTFPSNTGPLHVVLIDGLNKIIRTNKTNTNLYNAWPAWNTDTYNMSNLNNVELIFTSKTKIRHILIATTNSIAWANVGLNINMLKDNIIDVSQQ